MDDSPSPHAGLSEAYSAGRARLRRLRWIQVGISLGFAAVAVGFLVSLKSRLEHNFRPEKLEWCARLELKKLQPSLRDSARNVVADVGPKCLDMGKARVKTLLPKLQVELDRELRDLGAGLSSNAEKKIAGALARVQAAQLERLADRVPALRDEAALNEVSDAWVRNVAEDSTVILERFHERAMVDVDRLARTLDGFAASRFDDVERDQLLKYYAHLWVALIDQELLEASMLEGRDDG